MAYIFMGRTMKTFLGNRFAYNNDRNVIWVDWGTETAMNEKQFNIFGILKKVM